MFPRLVTVSAALTAAQRDAVAALERAAFPPDPANSYTWQKPTWHVMVWLGEALVSYLGLCARTATVDGQPVRLGGVGSVMTDPVHRRQGYSSLALQEAAIFMRDDIGADFGLLVTGTDLIPFYGRLGWQPVDGPMTFSQPQGNTVVWHEVTMVLPLTGQPWPAGPIDLCGLPW